MLQQVQPEKNIKKSGLSKGTKPPMTKRRPPSSPEHALNESILALDPAPSIHDQEVMVETWERAAEISERSVTQLYEATNPDQNSNGSHGRSRKAPIYLRDIEKIDLENMRAGKPGYNSVALTERLKAKLAGLELPKPSAEIHLQRAIIELNAAIETLRNYNDCNQRVIHNHTAIIQKLLADLMLEWSRREETARNRRESDRKPEIDVDHPKPGRPQLRAVKDK